MSDLTRLIDTQIRDLSEMSDESLDSMMLTIERAYVHALIEKNLRSGVSPRSADHWGG